MKEQENPTEEELDEMEASNLSDREFRVMTISTLNSMIKNHRNHKEEPVKNKEYISEINNILEGGKNFQEPP